MTVFSFRVQVDLSSSLLLLEREFQIAKDAYDEASRDLREANAAVQALITLGMPADVAALSIAESLNDIAERLRRANIRRNDLAFELLYAKGGTGR